MLATYGAAQNEHIYLWNPDDTNVSSIRTLTHGLSALEKDRLRENNRLEVSEISATHDMVLEDEIQENQNKIDTIISTCDSMKKNHDLLMSVIGIGKVMSRELVYLFSAKNFSTAKQVAAYVGLTPKLNESGSFKGRTTLSKIGPS